MSLNRFKILKPNTGSSCFQNELTIPYYSQNLLLRDTKPRNQVEKSNLKTFGKSLKNNCRPTICTTI